MKYFRLTFILFGLILFGGSFASAENIGKVAGEATLSLVDNTLKMNNIKFDAEFTDDGPYLKTTDLENPLRIHGESSLISGDQYASSWNISDSNGNKRFWGVIAIKWDWIFPYSLQSYEITGTITFTTESDNKDNLKEFTMPLDAIVQCDGNCMFNPGNFNFSSTLACNDIIHPTITLNGPDSLTIEQGLPYEELGAVATDRVGNILPVIISPSPFTTDKPVGQYYISYNTQDAKGYSAEPKIRTVTIASNDHIPPYIRLTEPLNDETNIVASTTIYIFFSEAMDASSITDAEDNFYVTDSQGERIPGERNYADALDGASNANASFTPTADFAYQETYTVHLTTGVKDQAGNPLETEFTLTFSTESRPQDIQEEDDGGGGSGCFISTVRYLP